MIHVVQYDIATPRNQADRDMATMVALAIHSYRFAKLHLSARCLVTGVLQ